MEYDAFLCEVCGLSSATRFYRRRYARDFLGFLEDSGKQDLAKVSVHVLRRYVQFCAGRIKPASARVLTVSLRSFLRFLDLIGRIDSRIVGAVPTAAAWPREQPPETLSAKQLRVLQQSFDRRTSTGRRDHAMALLLAYMGLRTHEVAGLTLEDVDWQRGSLRLRQTKQRRERAIPLSDSARQAIADYLRYGRPRTDCRLLFVRHHLPSLGGPLSVELVRGAMRRAFARSGINTGRVHLLRHTLATNLHCRGVGLKAIADLLGHQSLNTAARYARVNIEQLRQAALPWPR